MPAVSASAAKKAAKELNNLIEKIYSANVNGRSINIMDIEKVFVAGEQAWEAGQDIEAAVKSKMEELCFHH